MPRRNKPIDDFIKAAAEFLATDREAAAKYQEYRGRRGKELEQWHVAKKNNFHPDHVSPLLQSMKPLIRSEANKRMQGLGGSISRSAIESELTNAALKGIKSYKPGEGAALSTWVTSSFPRVSDFVNANRNAKYVPGEDMKRYQRFQNAHDELHDELGRPPTVGELQTRLPWKPKAIEKMQRSFGSEAYTDMGDHLSPNDEAAPMGPRDAFYAVHSQLKPLERSFGDMYYPPAGEKAPGIKNIAKALGVPEHKAYRLKDRLETKMGPLLKKQ